MTEQKLTSEQLEKELTDVLTDAVDAYLGFSTNTRNYYISIEDNIITIEDDFIYDDDILEFLKNNGGISIYECSIMDQFLEAWDPYNNSIIIDALKDFNEKYNTDYAFDE